MQTNLAERTEVEDVAKLKLDELRQISNVIQALENLVVQCEGAEDFLELQNRAKNILAVTRRKLSCAIHLA